MARTKARLGAGTVTKRMLRSPAATVRADRIARRGIPVLLLCLALWGCSGQGTGSGGVSRVDSAGVTIVTNPASVMSAAATWTLASRPALEIDAPADGSFVLFGVGDVVPLSHARLAVANRGSHEVLVFDSAGTLVARIGREGDGPGEFQFVTSLARLPGDSLVVWDSGHRRLSVFDNGGTLGHEAMLGKLVEQTHAAYEGVYALADGDLVFNTGAIEWAPHEGSSRALSASVRIGTDGSVRSSYGMFPGTEAFSSGDATGMVPFGASTTVTTSGDDFVVGTEVTTELRVFGPDGTLARIVRWPDHERLLTDARFQAYVNDVFAAVPKARQEAIRDRLEKMPRAKSEPPYWTVLADSDGRLWVGDYPGQESFVGLARPRRHWLIFGPDGAVTARLDTPAGFGVKSIRGPDVIGVYTDKVGVESVRIYRIAAR